MKKTKILKAVSTLGLSVCAITPIISMSSCSKDNTNRNILSDEVLSHLKDITVDEFKRLCMIPHSSDKLLNEDTAGSKGNVWEMSCYLRNRLAILLNCDISKIFQDRFGNIVADVPANDSTLENAPEIALQAHMDMVFSYDESKFTSKPDPKTYRVDIVDEMIDGHRIIHSRDWKTTIGGDNGSGIASILALLQVKEFKHGKIRIIMTNCEENAMQGIKLLIDGTKDDEGRQIIAPTYPDVLKDIKFALNLDSGWDGQIIVGCGGGIGSRFHKEKITACDVINTSYVLTIDGFLGGHSAGAPGQGHGNALYVAMEILNKINKSKHDIQLASISSCGTTAYNKITSKCKIEFTTSETIDNINKVLDDIAQSHKASSNRDWTKYIDVDRSKWSIESKQEKFTKVINTVESANIINLHTTLGYGVDKWEPGQYEGQLIKSSKNIGPCELSLTNDGFNFETAAYPRSDEAEQIQIYKNNNIKAATDYGFSHYFDAEFPPWQESLNCNFYNLLSKALFNAGIAQNKIKPIWIPGAIECCWLSKAKSTSTRQCMSIGIEVENEHQPDEYLRVDTIPGYFNVMEYILLNLKDIV